MSVSIGSITSADATFFLTIPGLFSTPQQIFQFDVDDAFDSEAVENGEIVKGVDGWIAAAWVPTLPKLNCNLMANSPSNDVFTQWFQAEQQQKAKIPGTGLIVLPGPSQKFTILNCYQFGFMHLPPAKKRLMGRKFVLMADDIVQSALAAA